MRVHSITVRDVRGVRERTVTFPDSGVVVVEGPNEVGKSTVLEAFDKLLDPRLKATSASREVRALQPVGQDVGPYVEAEFTVGGQRVRFAKQWLRRPSTTLQVLEPAPRQLSGEAAQAYLDRLVGASLDRTLWDALRFTQSQDGTLIPLVDSTVLSSALDAAAGAHLHAEEGEQVLDLVGREYSTYFTRTGRPTGDYKQAMTGWTVAQEAVAEAHRRLQEAEELLARQVSLKELAAEATDELTTARAEHEAAAEAHAAVAEVVAAHEQARARLGEASEKARSATRARTTRRELVAAVDELEQRIRTATATLAAQESAAEQLIDGAAGLEEEAAAADERLERAEAASELALADAEHLALVAAADRLEERRRVVEDVVARLAAARAALPSRGVGREDLRRVTALSATEERLRALHELASAKVRVEALDSRVDVRHRGADGSEEERATAVAPQGAESFALVDELVVSVPGAVRVTVVPEQGAQERLTALRAAREELGQALADLGVGSLVELTETVEEQDRCRELVRDLTHELEVALAGRPAAELAAGLAGQVPDGLTDELARLREQISTWAQTRPDGLPAPQDVAAAEAAQRAASLELRTARDERRRLVAALKEQRQQAATLRAGIDRAAGRLESDRAQLVEATRRLESAREQVADDALDAQLQARSTALAAAEVEAQRAGRAVAEADVDGLSRRVLAAAERVDRAQAQLDQRSAALHALTGQIATWPSAPWPRSTGAPARRVTCGGLCRRTARRRTAPTSCPSPGPSRSWGARSTATASPSPSTTSSPSPPAPWTARRSRSATCPAAPRSSWASWPASPWPGWSIPPRACPSSSTTRSATATPSGSSRWARCWAPVPRAPRCRSSC